MQQIKAVKSRPSLFEKKGLLAILTIIFYLLVRLLYAQEIAPANSFSFFHTSSFLSLEILTVIFFSLIPLFFLPKYLDTPSSMISWMLFSFSYLPTAFIGIYFTDSLINYCQLMLLLALGLITFRLTTLIKFRFTNWRKVDFVNLDYFAIFFLSLLIIYLTWRLPTFSIDLSFSDVYERRMNARKFDIGILAYLMVFIKTGFLVLAVYLWFVRKDLLYLIASFLGLIAVFSFYGTKVTILLGIVLIAYGFFAFYFNRKARRPSLLLLVFISICVIGLIEWNFFKSNLIAEYIVRRMFVISGIINSYYFDYFNAFPGFMSAPEQIPFIIGEEYFFRKESNANSGIWMDSYAKAGLFGILLASLFSGFIAVILDAMTEKNKGLLGVLIGLMVGITWSEQALTTSILSGGIFFYILILIWIKISLRLNAYSTQSKF